MKKKMTKLKIMIFLFHRNAILGMSLKSSIMSRLDHQMSISWSRWSSSPVGKKGFLFLPDPILVGWLKILHLINFSMWMLQCRVCLFFKEISYSPDCPDSPNGPKLKIHLWWQQICLCTIFQGIAPKCHKWRLFNQPRLVEKSLVIRVLL